MTANAFDEDSINRDASGRFASKTSGEPEDVDMSVGLSDEERLQQEAYNEVIPPGLELDPDSVYGKVMNNLAVEHASDAYEGQYIAPRNAYPYLEMAQAYRQLPSDAHRELAARAYGEDFPVEAEEAVRSLSETHARSLIGSGLNRDELSTRIEQPETANAISSPAAPTRERITSMVNESSSQAYRDVMNELAEQYANGGGEYPYEQAERYASLPSDTHRDLAARAYGSKMDYVDKYTLDRLDESDARRIVTEHGDDPREMHMQSIMASRADRMIMWQGRAMTENDRTKILDEHIREFEFEAGKFGGGAQGERIGHLSPDRKVVAYARYHSESDGTNGSFRAAASQASKLDDASAARLAKAFRLEGKDDITRADIEASSSRSMFARFRSRFVDDE